MTRMTSAWNTLLVILRTLRPTTYNATVAITAPFFDVTSLVFWRNDCRQGAGLEHLTFNVL